MLVLIAVVYAAGCRANSVQLFSSPKAEGNIFRGQYAFLLSGFDASGNPVAMAGSITANGFGQIIGGSVDVNDDFIMSTNADALTGSYTLDKNSRGMITLTNSIGSVAEPLTLAFTLKADGSAGNLIEIDANNFLTAGTIQQQQSSAFSLGALVGTSGAFAFEFDSDAPSRNGMVGRFQLSANGSSSNALADVSSAGNGLIAADVQLVVSFDRSGPDTNGRSTLNMSINGSTSSYIYYVIDAGNLLALQMGPNNSNTLQSGVVRKQNLPFSSSTVNTGGSVFALTGSDAGIPRGISSIGLFQVKGAAAAGLQWDTNDSGRLFSEKSSASGSVDFDLSTGRGTIDLPGGFANGLFDQAVFYLTSSGNGFLLDSSTAAHNRGLVGSMKSQANQEPFSGETVSGNMIVGSIGPSISITTFVQQVVDGAISKNISNNTFAVSFVGDFDSTSGPAIANIATTRTEAFAIDPDSGRGTNTFRTSTKVFYIIGPRQYVLIDQSALPNRSAIEFVDPQ